MHEDDISEGPCLVDVATAQTTNNDIKGAMATANLNQDPAWKVKALVGIAIGHI